MSREAAAAIVDKLTVGSKVVIAADAELRGTITIGNGCVLHPRASIVALGGPVHLGADCIVEENVRIVNRRSEALMIGESNLFEVGCFIEAAEIGSHNTFEPRCSVASSVRIGSYTSVGATCVLSASPVFPDDAAAILAEAEHGDEGEEVQADAPREERLPDHSVIFGTGAQPQRRLWSGEGVQQQAALHAKHLEYLRQNIPQQHKLRMIT
ncbi:trimeric LpxA-like protein [Tilletiopsis washingtonensis]|uniref:Dynactin subunit 6 n=1 Tax=Tilletiopsis washingtonensis TaxID=58919 RepID=A0A316Z572_9BASI|nr:trimeric LpxA-like protein [Tilletiopsis washingtonensis]PWN96927.1 trimeric LpxA-like protein [Tilletiopsis washingtonensis]